MTVAKNNLNKIQNEMITKNSITGRGNKLIHKER
jgi:hypothetical protein